MDLSDGDRVFRPTDKASIALLRRVRAGDHVPHFVHRVDVCDAPPELLVAHMEPVPGTGLDDGGYSSVWYCYHAKKFTNKQGKLSGHRQRKVTGGGGAGWHSEISPKDVQGSGGGTSCTLSYGLKIKDSAKSFDRMGWCMVEYDDLAAASNSNYVLCKVYRTPRPHDEKGNSSSSTPSSSKKQASSKQTAKKKRKAAGGGDHPEAPPAKSASTSIQQQEQQVQHGTACYQPQGVEYWEHGGDFDFNIEDLNFYVDESMLRAEPEPEPEHDGRFIKLPCGPVLAAVDMLGPKTAVQPDAESENDVHDKNIEEFTVEWLLRGEPQQPIVKPPPGHGGEFIQMPFGPVVPVLPETTVEDMLGLGAETLYGQWSGGITTTIPPWSSYSPASSSSYAGCSSLLQGPDPLQLPYLTC